MRKLATLIVESKEVRTPRDMEGYMIANKITYKTLPMPSEAKGKSEEEKKKIKEKINVFVEEIREAYKKGTNTLEREEEIYNVLQKYMTQEGKEHSVIQSSMAEIAATSVIDSDVETNVEETVGLAEEVVETAGENTAVATETIKTEVFEETLDTSIEEAEVVVEEAEETTEEFVEVVAGGEMTYITPKTLENQETKEVAGAVSNVVVETVAADGTDIMGTLAACFINELDGGSNPESINVFNKIREENNVIYRKGKTQEDIELFVERTAKRKKTLEEKVEVLATHFGRTLNQKKK